MVKYGSVRRSAQCYFALQTPLKLPTWSVCWNNYVYVCCSLRLTPTNEIPTLVPSPKLTLLPYMKELILLSQKVAKFLSFHVVCISKINQTTEDSHFTTTAAYKS